VRPFFILLRKELKTAFFSPLAYIVMAFIMALNGVPFVLSLLRMQSGPSQHSLVYLTFTLGGWFWMSFLLLFPIITMRLFAEEQKMGTLESLLTVPVRTTHVVLAKYFSALIFYCVLWAPSLINFAVFEWISGESAAYNEGSFAGTYLMLFLLGAFNVAIGCMASAMTSSQIVAAVTAFSIILLHFFIGFFHLFTTHLPSDVMERVTYTSSYEHMRIFADGLLDTRPIVYYLSAAAFTLILTHQILEYRKWRI
jgi:ABC-2 type transport system permease protein